MNRIYPIHSLSAAKTYEESILQGDASHTTCAMENAGRAIGNTILSDFREYREWPETPRLLVLAGKGLNAGDAFVACESLYKALPGLWVTIVETSPAESLNPLARNALERLISTMEDRLQRVSVEAYLSAPQA
ncbi:MAG TPA: NAD(P)H-hydrate epimerase, partial [Oceanipulchritudo sp.]|nr:NAD(P)H-hydrate epimerase [Oceanipulchritudo sp.]